MAAGLALDRVNADASFLQAQFPPFISQMLSISLPRCDISETAHNTI